MDETEIVLSGGNVNAAVVRVGDTVRRVANTWSETVHGLLRHLEAQGFEDCPRFLGMDIQGREILSYFEGEVGFMPYLWEGDEPLIMAARLLRRYHDATVGYLPKNAQWQCVYPDVPQPEVICHNDFAPYNLVCRNKRPIAIIDFDTAAPGLRLRDIAYAVYWFAPLSFGGELCELSLSDRDNGSRRLHLFCETYGIAANAALLDMVSNVLQFMGDWLEQGAGQDNPAHCRMIAEGHLAQWRKEEHAFKEQKPLLRIQLE